MKTSPVCISYKVRLQTEMQYAFPDVAPLQSALCFGCPPGLECTLTKGCWLHTTQTVLGQYQQTRFQTLSGSFMGTWLTCKQCTQKFLALPVLPGCATRAAAPQEQSRMKGSADIFLAEPLCLQRLFSL